MPNADHTLDGPHGLLVVGDTGFARGGHEDASKDNPKACRACHGRNGEDTVLSRMATTRVLECKERTAFCPDGDTQEFPQGHEVTCSDCHETEL